MRTRNSIPTSLALLTLFVFAVGCGGSNNSVTAPQYEPEVVNTPNVVFTFQATGLTEIDDVASYYWDVSSGNIVIHPSTSTTSGNLTLDIRDDSGVVVYNGDIPASGDITPPAGAPGSWRIRISLQNYSGTINFELQMQ